MEGIWSNPVDFLFFDPTIEAATVFGLAKWMERMLFQNSIGWKGSVLVCHGRQDGRERRLEMDWLTLSLKSLVMEVKGASTCLAEVVCNGVRFFRREDFLEKDCWEIFPSRG